MSDDVFAARRARVLELLGADGALVLAAAPELRVGADGELRYRPDPDLWYLTGYPEPQAVLVLCPSADPPFTLFVRPRDQEAERWAGRRGGIEAASTRYGADRAHDVAELDRQLPKLIAGARVLYAPLDSPRPEFTGAVGAALRQARRDRQRSGRGVHTVVDPHVLLGPLRMRKDAHELERLRTAADITVAAFGDALRTVRGAEGEWQVEAELEGGFRARGASGPAFPSIVAGGANATVLHYTANDAPLKPGELLLIDAGARWQMYCADITRTVPVSGRFNAAQRAVYDVVRRAHDAAVAAARAGSAAAGLEDAALAVLIDGMRELGLLRATRDEVLEGRLYRRYFPHRTSHWLGLDVHDAGDYVTADGEPVTLEPGMVLTVEPGLYIPADDDAAPAALRGTGVRLEDDVLVTESAPEVLTRALPIDADEVETILQEAGPCCD